MIVRKEDNPLRDSQGRYRTQSLFWELRQEGYEYLWTLFEEDLIKEGKKVPSLKKIYMSYAHTPENEYEFAIEMFGSWTHWLRLQEAPFFAKELTKWREELDIKNRAESIRAVIKASAEGDVTASKFLVDKFTPKTRGRPSKDEKNAALKQSVAEYEEYEKELSRIGLKAVS